MPRDIPQTPKTQTCFEHSPCCFKNVSLPGGIRDCKNTLLSVSVLTTIPGVSSVWVESIHHHHNFIQAWYIRHRLFQCPAKCRPSFCTLWLACWCPYSDTPFEPPKLGTCEWPLGVQDGALKHLKLFFYILAWGPVPRLQVHLRGPCQYVDL